MKGRAVFVIAACDDGPMILARTDYQFVRRLDPLGKEIEGVIGVGASLLENGSHEQEQVDLLLQLTAHRRADRQGELAVLDVGANIGTHTVPWAKFMLGWGTIVAFEPQRWLYYALCGNLALNNVFNATALNFAVSDQDGIMPGPVMDYSLPANFGGVSMLEQFNREQPVRSYEGIVKTIAIDSMGLNRLDVLKIDVEGMEPQVVRGARATIAAHRPIIVAEHSVCGKSLLLDEMPKDYRCDEIGRELLCMPKSDPIWQRIRLVREAA